MTLASPHRLIGSSAASLGVLALLAACGGGDGSEPAAAAPVVAVSPGVAVPPAVVVPPVVAAPAPTTLSGTVAVGAPITNGKLRILDADGAVVAADVAIDADGRYADVALTGPAPYRIEACGHAGANYLCVYSVAGAPGTANVTPLTTATVLLATGEAPEGLMSGAATALTSASVAEAQAQLRTSLASVLASADVAADFDFVSGALAAGSRSGYDGVLDAIGVALGQDTKPFVQITPRLGTGNLYLEQGSSAGTVTASAGTAALGLGGLETLFRNMSEALASETACSGLAPSLAADARMTFDTEPAVGPADVARALCGFFAGGEDGQTPMWGSRFLSPTLGRCELTGAVPVCGVSFVLQTADGEVQPVGSGMGVTQEAGVWKFAGDLLPIPIQASARAQRTRRLGTDSVELDRALAFDIAAVPGLACAAVAQRDGAANPITIGYYKRHPGADDQQRLALWTADGSGNRAGLDPLVGATRQADDTWIALPQGDEGDAAVRNFYRGGRSVTVSLYADGACSVPFVVAGRSAFDVEVEGVPPVWAAMQNLPWPELDDATQAALRDLTIAAGAEGTLSAAWTFARGPLGLDDAVVCGDRASCGQGGSGRLAEQSVRASARSAVFALRNTGPSIAAGDYKMLSLSGRNSEGVGLQSNYTVCPTAPDSPPCR